MDARTILIRPVISEKSYALIAEGKYTFRVDDRAHKTQIAQAVPDLSDRLLSERMKELEARGIVVRHVSQETPVKVCYELTEKGRQLAPALDELTAWADRWLV